MGFLACKFRGQRELYTWTLTHLAAGYNADADFALHARMIPALAFVSIQDLDAAFQELSDNSPPEQQPVLDWLEDN